MTVLGNDHLLVTVLLDVCETIGALTLLGALALGKPKPVSYTHLTLPTKA